MTLRRTIAGALATAALAGGLGAAAAPAFAADPPQATGCVRGRDLMTEEERQAHRTKMAAASDEEQAKLRAAMHAEMVKRAAAKKQPLCAKGPGAGPGPGGPPGAP
jgi:hypothetical protein